MMCVGHRQRGNAPAAAMPAPAIPVMGLPGGPQARPMPRPGAPPALSNHVHYGLQPCVYSLQPHAPQPATPDAASCHPIRPRYGPRDSGHGG